MCFTNLPIEFDNDGNPYIEEEAEAVDHPSDDATDDDFEDMETVGCVECDPGDPLAELDPDDAYERVLEVLPDDIRETVAGHESDTAGMDWHSHQNPRASLDNT